MGCLSKVLRKMDKNHLKSTAQRLNIYDEAVIKKTEEYLRLYQSKALVKILNDQAKTVLCLDLASQSVGKGFDKVNNVYLSALMYNNQMEIALTLCGLKKSAYQNSLNIVEKVLGLDNTLTVSDICVQLGCTVIKQDAEDILTTYKKIDGTNKDLEHPQYVAAATYLACKAKRISLDKHKIVSLSRLKPSQWKELVNAFESLGLGKNTEKQRTNETVADDNARTETGNLELVKKDEVEEVEQYEVWKKRMLKEAYAALKEEQETMEH